MNNDIINKSRIVKTYRISDELAKFLKKPNGYYMSKCEVISYINNYISSNKLQDNENEHNVNHDIELSSLLS